MSDETAAAPEGFAEELDELLPYIRDEWPSVGREELVGTKGDYDAVVTLISLKTEHTRTLVRKQLDELRQMAGAQRAKRGWVSDAELRRLRELLERLQHKSNDVTDYVRERISTDARKQMHENPLVTLLIAIGLGFILGFILRGGGGRRG